MITDDDQRDPEIAVRAPREDRRRRVEMSMKSSSNDDFSGLAGGADREASSPASRSDIEGWVMDGSWVRTGDGVPPSLCPDRARRHTEGSERSTRYPPSLTTPNGALTGSLARACVPCAHADESSYHAGRFHCRPSTPHCRPCSASMFTELSASAVRSCLSPSSSSVCCNRVAWLLFTELPRVRANRAVAGDLVALRRCAAAMNPSIRGLPAPGRSLIDSALFFEQALHPLALLAARRLIELSRSA